MLATYCFLPSYQFDGSCCSSVLPGLKFCISNPESPPILNALELCTILHRSLLSVQVSVFYSDTPRTCRVPSAQNLFLGPDTLLQPAIPTWSLHQPQRPPDLGEACCLLQGPRVTCSESYLPPFASYPKTCSRIKGQWHSPSSPETTNCNGVLHQPGHPQASTKYARH